MATKASDWVVKPALCLDLDGTIRYNKNDPSEAGFINRADDIALYPDVEAKLHEYRNNGWLIVGVSNQGGVAFGYKTGLDVDAEVQRTLDLFEQNPFHTIQISFHHPYGTLEPYNHRSLGRKPDTGMLVMAEQLAFEASIVIDWDSSIMVGDRDEDRELAENARIGFVWANDFFGR